VFTTPKLPLSHLYPVLLISALDVLRVSSTDPLVQLHIFEDIEHTGAVVFNVPVACL
jgi:hypothetical protein